MKYFIYYKFKVTNKNIVYLNLKKRGLSGNRSFEEKRDCELPLQAISELAFAKQKTCSPTKRPFTGFLQ
ncbi:MAG: hypothetical protein SFU98_11495 [Leptospiraceae bacterium]|nr:hypothetical protein [Leptospiraceae bacterium]